MKTALRAAAALLLLSAAPVLAQQSQSATGSSSSQATGAPGSTGPGGAGRAPRTPPPEAVAACSGKSAGASCTFQHKDRTETGSCFTPDPSMPVACKPVRPPRDEGSAGGNASGTARGG